MGLGLLAGFAWSLPQPSTFSATASVALTPVPVYVTSSTTELAPPAVSIDTDAQLLRSPGCSGPSARLGVDEDAASGHLVVTAAPSSHVLHVTVRAASRRQRPTPPTRRSRRSPTSAARARGAAADQLSMLRLRVSEQEARLAQEQRRRVVVPASDDLFAELLELRTSLEELEEAASAAVVVRPGPPSEADYANAEVPMTSGAMLGLIGGCLLGAAHDRGRRSRGGPTTPRPRHPSDTTSAIRTTNGGYHHAT